MTKVFADIFKAGFEGSHSHGIEINHTCFALDIFIVQGDGCFRDGPVIQATDFSKHTSKVFHIESTSQTFSQQNRVGCEWFGYTSTGEDIGQIKFSSGF
jgi:hypothetical protein